MDTEDHYIYTDATIEEVKAEINGLIRFIEAQEAQGVNSQLYVQYRARFKKYLGRLRTYHRGWADIQTWIGTSVFKPRNTINRDIDLILRDYMRASAVARADRAAAEAAAARAAEAAAREAEAAAQEAEEAERRRHRRSESIPIPAPRGNVNRSRAPEPLITLSGVQFASSASSGDIFPYEPDQRRPSYEHRSEALMRQGPAAVAQHNARMREQARASAERRAQVAAQQQEEAVRALEVLERDQAARWARQAALGRGGGYGGNAYGHPQSYNVPPPGPPPSTAPYWTVGPPQIQSAPVGGRYGVQGQQHPYAVAQFQQGQQIYQGSQSSAGASTTGSEFTQSNYSTGGSSQGTGSWSGSG